MSRPLPFIFGVTVLTLMACGGQPTESKPYIANGIVVDSGNWSAQLSVKIQMKNSFCTGTVVGPRAILTAGHCFKDRTSQTDTSDITVSWMTGQTRKVKWYNRYTVDYNQYSNHINDLGLMELDGDSPFANGRQAWLTTNDEPKGYISGFGFSESGDFGTLRQAYFFNCKSYSNGTYWCVGQYPGTQRTDAYIKSADSGAGMMYWDSSTDRMIVTSVATISSDSPSSTTVVPIKTTRNKINYLNSNCRLKINGLPCN